MRRLQAVFIVGLCAIFMLGQWGCATQPPGLPAELRAQLGTIGVVSAQYTPAVEFELPAKGWIGGAARGAAGGTKAFIVLVPSAAVVGGVECRGNVLHIWGTVCAWFSGRFVDSSGSG